MEDDNLLGPRTFWRSERLNDKTLRNDRSRRRSARREANIVASLTEHGTHMPTLDIDHPALLDPSSTPGHWHLYLNVEMTWRQYRRILRALYLGGVIGRNAYWRSLDRGASFVRPPGVIKTEEERRRSCHTRSALSSELALWHARLRVAGKRVLWNLQELGSSFVRGR